MLNAYLSESPVLVKLTPDELAIDICDNSIVSVKFKLLDEEENVLFSGEKDGIMDNTIIIDIPPEHNVISGVAPRTVRSLSLEIEAGGSVFVRTHEYIIERSVVLIDGVNSFQNYAKAVLTAFELPDIEGWNNASRVQRLAALIQSFKILIRLSYDDPRTGCLFRPLADALNSGYATISKDFKEALMTAQVLEANRNLGGEILNDYRNAGLQSITVGESKNFFRTGRSADANSSIGSRTYQVLAPYLHINNRLARA